LFQTPFPAFPHVRGKEPSKKRGSLPLGERRIAEWENGRRGE